MEISRELLKLLACPVTKEKLIYDKEQALLVSPKVALGFPIVDGVPILLKDMAKQLSYEYIKKLVSETEEEEFLATNEA